MANSNEATSEKSRLSAKTLVERMGGRFGVDADKLLHILKHTAFRQKKDEDGKDGISNEQIAALLVVCEQYNLNPFLKEIYAFPDKYNGIVPVVGVDGWSRIVNNHSQYDGEEFVYAEKMVQMPGTKIPCPEWIECRMFRKDRSRPTVIREYLDEVYRPPYQGTSDRGVPYVMNGPWQTHPKRFLRHKAFIQCGRIALGFTGIYDEDEANRIIDMGTVVDVSASQSLPALEQAKVDPVIDELIKRAQQMNNWTAPNQYIMQRFQGREFEYASNKLKAAEAEWLGRSEEPTTVELTQSEQCYEQRNDNQPPSGIADVFEGEAPAGEETLFTDPETAEAFSNEPVDTVED